jgi:hypothetical protein
MYILRLVSPSIVEFIADNPRILLIRKTRTAKSSLMDRTMCSVIKASFVSQVRVRNVLSAPRGGCFVLCDLLRDFITGAHTWNLIHHTRRAVLSPDCRPTPKNGTH